MELKREADEVQHEPQDANDAIDRATVDEVDHRETYKSEDTEDREQHKADAPSIETRS
jgi:hypothetical protein